MSTATTTLRREFAIIDTFGFELERVTIELPINASIEQGQASAIAEYTEQVRSGYEPGSYKADAVISTIARADYIAGKG
jgi:hypothetical protein